MFNSFAKKKKKPLYQYKKPSFLGVGGRVPEKQEVSQQIISGKEACMHSDCTDGLFDSHGGNKS